MGVDGEAETRVPSFLEDRSFEMGFKGGIGVCWDCRFCKELGCEVRTQRTKSQMGCAVSSPAPQN
jgi:hypothetical protein